MDVSDGLLRDAGRMAAASGARLDIDPAAPALAAARGELEPLAAALGADAGTWVLTGGEDHALLAAFPPGAALPPGFRAIGRVRAGRPAALVAGRPWSGRAGWDHFGA
jgi:thiamine-monophosphate kinase